MPKPLQLFYVTHDELPFNRRMLHACMRNNVDLYAFCDVYGDAVKQFCVRVLWYCIPQTKYTSQPLVYLHYINYPTYILLYNINLCTFDIFIIFKTNMNIYSMIYCIIIIIIMYMKEIWTEKKNSITCFWKFFYLWN